VLCCWLLVVGARINYCGDIGCFFDIIIMMVLIHFQFIYYISPRHGCLWLVHWMYCFHGCCCLLFVVCCLLLMMMYGCSNYGCCSIVELHCVVLSQVKCIHHSVLCCEMHHTIISSYHHTIIPSQTYIL